MKSNKTLSITFCPLKETNLPMLLSWLQNPHVRKWWDSEKTYTPESLKEKYLTYTQGYKIENGVKKAIHPFIFSIEGIPVGYIQYFNAHDFIDRNFSISNLPQSLAAVDMFIGDTSYLQKGIGAQVLADIVANIIFNEFEHVLIDPALDNYAAIRCFSKAGFSILKTSSKENRCWMLKSKNLKAENVSLLNQLAIREPIFHHPVKFGATKTDLQNMTSTNFWEVGASGNIYTRKECIHTLLERYKNKDFKDIWEAQYFKLTEIAPDSYLLTYSLMQDNARHTQRSTIWQRNGKNWQILYHQGTLVSETN